MLKPKRDGTVESHPFDSAQGRLFRKVRRRMGHPRTRGSKTPAQSLPTAAFFASSN
jgi:hypothetical protein